MYEFIVFLEQDDLSALIGSSIFFNFDKGAPNNLYRFTNPNNVQIWVGVLISTEEKNMHTQNFLFFFCQECSDLGVGGCNLFRFVNRYQLLDAP